MKGTYRYSILESMDFLASIIFCLIDVVCYAKGNLNVIYETTLVIKVMKFLKGKKSFQNTFHIKLKELYYL